MYGNAALTGTREQSGRNVQHRHQGYSDGYSKREPRWPGEKTYMESYRRGAESRRKADEDGNEAA